MVTHDNKHYGTIELVAGMNVVTGEVLYGARKSHSALGDHLARNLARRRRPLGGT